MSMNVLRDVQKQQQSYKRIDRRKELHQLLSDDKSLFAVYLLCMQLCRFSSRQSALCLWFEKEIALSADWPALPQGENRAKDKSDALSAANDGQTNCSSEQASFPFSSSSGCCCFSSIKVLFRELSWDKNLDSSSS